MGVALISVVSATLSQTVEAATHGEAGRIASTLLLGNASQKAAKISGQLTKAGNV